MYPEGRGRIVSGNVCSVQDPRDLGIRDLKANCCLFPLLNPAQRIYEGGSACGRSRYLALHEMDYMHNRRYLVRCIKIHGKIN
jgi:hypothetical protein